MFWPQYVFLFNLAGPFVAVKIAWFFINFVVTSDCGATQNNYNEDNVRSTSQNL